jgi:3-hydroxybutyryl-CoA dehydrogenase
MSFMDMALNVANLLYPALDRTAGPHPFLQAKLANGHLGMKTGEDFRKWSASKAWVVRSELSRFLIQKAKLKLTEKKSP